MSRASLEGVMRVAIQQSATGYEILYRHMYVGVWVNRLQRTHEVA